MKTMARKISFLSGLLLVFVMATGCRVPANTPMLTTRSLMNVKLTIETEPREAHVFAENFRFMGKAPVTQTWPLEKLTWSDGRTNFRILPKGTRLESGEELSANLTVRAKGYKEKSTTISIPFSGKEETFTRKIVLEKK
jgi:hypothetical protein